jgi:hemoglobin
MSDRDWILKVVASFYDKAKIDVLIGYHFWVIQDFDTHIPRIAAFWEIQLLGSTEKTLTQGFDVRNVHLPMVIKRGELGRWLVLFNNTLDEEVLAHPEFMDLANLWRERLKFFEGAFLRFLSF